MLPSTRRRQRLTAIRCPLSLPARHEAQVYAKRDGSPDLRPYRDRLLAMGGALAGVEHPHVWPVQRVYESERAAFLLRQYQHANLAQRITTRPFLTLVEKVGLAAQVHSSRHRHAAASRMLRRPTADSRLLAPFHSSQRWIAYQLLLALVQCHERGVCHGDIRTENVALTSWDW